VQRRQTVDDIHEHRQSVGFDEVRVELLLVLRDFLEVLGENAELVVVEGVDVDGRVRLVGRDVLHLAAVDALRALNRIAHRVAAAAVVADHAACDADLLRADNAVVARDDARARRNVDTRGAVADDVEDERVEHVDALGDDDGILAALHRVVAARAAVHKVVPGDLGDLALGELLDALHQQLHIHTVGRFPVIGLGRALVQSEEEVVHAEQAHLHAQVLQVRFEPHGGRGLAGAGRTRERNERLLILDIQDGRGCGTDFVVKDFLAAQHELRLVFHRIGDVFQIDNTHNMTSFRIEVQKVGEVCSASSRRRISSRQAKT